MRKLATILGTFAGFVGVAVAAFIAATTMQGQVTTGDFQVFLNSSVTADNCTATQIDSSTMQVDWAGPIAGDTCLVTADFQGLASNGGPAVLEGVTLLGVAGEVTAELGLDCGVSIVGASTVTVTLLLRVTDVASPGVTYDLAGVWSWAPAATADTTTCL